MIALALGSAVFTAVMMILPFLKHTSFQNIGITMEGWVAFALFIILRCESWHEASVKTFVFFLISQPLIYLLMAPFSAKGLGLFQYYGYWFMWTVLTLPGAAIAYQAKRRNWLSVAVLSVAIAFLGYTAAYFFWQLTAQPPRYLITVCYCVGYSVFMAVKLLDKKAHRIAAIAVLVVSLAASLYVLKPLRVQSLPLDEGNWTFSVEDPSVAQITISDGNTLTASARAEGSTLVFLTNDHGDKIEVWVSVINGSVMVGVIE